MIEEREYNILCFVNSIGIHIPDPTIGWPIQCWGMGATQPDKDWVHGVQLGLTTVFKTPPRVAIVSGDFNRTWGDGADVDGRTTDGENTAWGFCPDIVIAQMGDNGARDPDQAAWLAIMRKIVSWTPTATLRLAVGLWEIPSVGDNREQAIKNCAGETGVNMVYVPIHDLHIIGVTDGTPHGYPHGGVRWHPGNLGMFQIRKRIVSTIIANI